MAVRKLFVAGWCLWLWLIEKIAKLVYTRKKKNQQKRQLNSLEETLNDFVINNSVNVNNLEFKILEQKTNGQSNDFKSADKSVRQNQVIEKKIDDEINRAVLSG